MTRLMALPGVPLELLLDLPLDLPLDLLLGLLPDLLQALPVAMEDRRQAAVVVEELYWTRFTKAQG
jgi:hypothetical protein